MSKAKLYKTYNLFIKIAIILFSAGFIVHRLFLRPDNLSLAERFPQWLEGVALLPVGLIALLMMLNWSLEALKWRFLIRKIESIPFVRAFMAVWAGLTLGIFTPNRIGEYFGRPFILRQANRWEGAFITVTGSISQLIVTMLAGAIALIYLVYYDSRFSDLLPSTAKIILASALLAANVVILLLYFRPAIILVTLRQIIPGRALKLRRHAEVFARFSTTELCKALLLSTLRYLVFSIQFFIALRICQIPLDVGDAIAIIPAIYLTISAIPSFTLAEIGVRGSVSIFYLERLFMFRADILPGIAVNAALAAFLIWIVNLILPSAIGWIFVFRLKFFRK